MLIREPNVRSIKNVDEGHMGPMGIHLVMELETNSTKTSVCLRGPRTVAPGAGRNTLTGLQV